jgi:hypothetical protein
MVRTVSLAELDQRIAAETDPRTQAKLKTMRPFMVRREAVPATGFDGNNKRIVWLIGDPHAAAVRGSLDSIQG